MINIAHPFDRYLRALTAVMPNAADSGAFSGLPSVMGRAIKDIGSWTFWLPHWRKRRAQAHLFSRQMARRDLRKTRRGNASGLTPASAGANLLLGSVFAPSTFLWPFSLFSSLSLLAFSGGCMRASSSPRTTPYRRAYRRDQVAGAISELDVNDNQIVKASTVLARIDDAVYASQLAQAEAQVEQLRANIANLVTQRDAQYSRVDQSNKQASEA
jgi:hypothetical protein